MKKHAWWIILVIVIIAALILFKGREAPYPQEKPLIGEDAAARTQTAENIRSTTTNILNNILCDLNTQNVAFDVTNPTDTELVINPKFRSEDIQALKILWNSAKGGDLTNPSKLCGAETITPGQTLHCIGYLGKINAAKSLEGTASAPRPNELSVFVPGDSQFAKVFCS